MRLRLSHTELLAQNALDIWSHNTVESIDRDLDARFEEVSKQIEVKNLSHQLKVILNRVDDLHSERVTSSVDVGKIELANGVDATLKVWTNVVLADLSAERVDLVSELSWSWTAIRAVELDTKVGVWTARVVAGGQNDSSICLVLANGARDGRRAHDAILGNNDLADLLVGSAQLQDLGDTFSAKESAITAYDDGDLVSARLRSELFVDGIEERLNEILHIVGLLEVFGALSETAGASLLVLEGRGRRFGDAKLAHGEK